MLKTAVVKVSFKEPAGRVLKMIHAMRSLGTAEVHLVHVRSSGGGVLAEGKRVFLEDLRQQAADMGLQADLHTFWGHPPSRVIQAAWHLDVDYIAIPWVQKPVLQQALMGSIDEDIVRMSDAPVFIYKGSLFSQAESLDSVLYATDFKGSDSQVMPYLRDKDFQARTLYILHVGDRAPDPVADKQRRDKVMEQLRELAGQCMQAYEEVVPLEVLGRARTRIIKKAKVLGVDLIVVGKGGRPDMLKSFLGSTAEYLPHKSHCSVFIIPTVRDREQAGGEQS